MRIPFALWSGVLAVLVYGGLLARDFMNFGTLEFRPIVLGMVAGPAFAQGEEAGAPASADTGFLDLVRTGGLVGGLIFALSLSMVSGRAMAKPSRKPARPQNFPKLFSTMTPG